MKPLISVKFYHKNKLRLSKYLFLNSKFESVVFLVSFSRSRLVKQLKKIRFNIFTLNFFFFILYTHKFRRYFIVVLNIHKKSYIKVFLKLIYIKHKMNKKNRAKAKKTVKTMNPL